MNIGKVYWSCQKCCEFVDAIAEVQDNEVRKHLGKCKLVSVIVDGSMDSSLMDNEMIYFQTSLEGVVHIDFLCQYQVEGGTAEGIVHAIKWAMETVIDWDQYIAK